MARASESTGGMARAGEDAAVYEDIREVLGAARGRAASAVDREMVLAYWEVGRRIHEAVGDRAEYGKHLIEYLSERLTGEFGSGFTVANLKNMRQFHRTFEKSYAVRSELSWTHFRILMRIEEPDKRGFYYDAAVAGRWSSRKLEHEMHSLCFERARTSGQKALNTAEGDVPGKALPAFPVKDPYMLDFLGLPEPARLHESDLEQALIDHMQDFLLELGTGFAFVGRQVRVSSELSDYYVDLVFYHTRLKCHVLVDLKAGKLDPCDIGQMDFYVRMFDDVVADDDDDNPTVGIVLRAEDDRAVAKYSALADGRSLFAARYVTALPTEEELAIAAERAMSRGRRDGQVALV